MTLRPSDIPDAIFPSEPLYDIPWLDPHMQADYIDAPCLPWGGHGSRRNINKGTWHFYVDDYRFQDLVWKNPAQLVNTDCNTTVEPNFSVFPQTPLAVTLGLTYRKRWLARYWQSCGVRVLVDLNVAPEHSLTNLLGVPRGWRAYATHGYSERLEDLQAEYDLACAHRGSSDIILLVYGGGDSVKHFAGSLTNAVYIPESRSYARG